MQTKEELRRGMAARRKTWTPEYLRASDVEIARRVRSLPEWAAARFVFAYVSVKQEPDTRALIAAALAAGKRVAVPRCLSDGVMEAREIRALDELRPAAFGLSEPGPDAPPALPDAFDLALVPCVAADRNGGRLGHGAGYYDRYLARTRAVRVCLCRGEALLDAVPGDAHDARMDCIVTENEVLRFSQALDAP